MKMLCIQGWGQRFTGVHKYVEARGQLSSPGDITFFFFETEPHIDLVHVY